MADFAPQPMLFVGLKEMVGGQNLRRFARGFEHDRGYVELVEPDVEDRIIEATGGAAGPRNVMVAIRRARLNSTASEPYSTPSAANVRVSGVSVMPLPAPLRRDFAANSLARAMTVSSNFEPGTTSSTSRHSTARLPLTPSSVVQNTSAWSRRTLRLSETRVRPPVPGSTASKGSSGNDTEAAPSSTSMM